MKKSLGKKLCFVGVGLIVLFMLLNIVLTYFFLIPFSTYLSEKQMEKFVMTIANRENYSDEKFMEYIEQFNDDWNTQITIVDKDKKIICTTRVSDYHRNELGTVTGALFDDNFDKLEQGKVATLTRNKENTNRIDVKVIKKIAENRYAVMVRTYRSLQNATYLAIMFEIIAGIVLIFVGFIVVYCTSRKLVIPIRKMTVTAEHISNLEFGMKINTKTEDELGKLGESINKMCTHLEINMEQLQNDIESRKRLVRNLSHEIKSPVAVIMGYADRLKAVILKDPEKALTYCEIISSESTRVDMLVKEMLELSKLGQETEELHPERFAASRLFEALKERFQNEVIEKNVRYIEEYEKEDILFADFMMLERAVYNLLRNAVIHGELEKMLVKITGSRNGDYYEFRVYNTGSFIKEEEFHSIWEAFSKADKVRTRGKKQGSGVGLAIVREIIEAHEGYYSVENKEDGVEFLIAVKG
ncbi:MAG: HAMP domain-containing histidine kinase [Lachnospiraceae bacterium]|nr:HAMP domain-containing histidine kinase [Lachnospiraceae bacterium]